MTARSGYQNPLKNWIPDTNRFKLEQPPDFFLAGLHNYDTQLVLLPSRMRRQYLLARRRGLTAGLGDVAMMDNKHPDTNMCYGYGVLPIAPLRWQKTQTDAGMFSQPNLDSLIATLRERDAWRLGDELGSGGGPHIRNPEAIADAIDAFDLAQERKVDRDTREMFYHQGRDAWRSLQARMGWRNKRASDAHGVARLPVIPAPPTEQRVTLTDAL